MKISRAGLDLIYEFEGKLKLLPDGRYKAYLCPANVPTIYAGCTEGVQLGMIVTEDEGEAMFRAEIAKFERAVDRLVTVDLNQSQFDALVSFAYNCGEGALARSTLLKRVNARDWKRAEESFAAWNKGGGRVLRGLVRRRRAEANLFASEDVQEMPQAVAETTPAPVKTIAGTAGAVAGGAGISMLGGPPDLSSVVAWKGFGEQSVSLGKWAAMHWWMVIPLALVGLVIYAARRQSA